MVYFILADETTDTSNAEDIIICVPWVDETLQAQGEFNALHPLNSTDAETVQNYKTVTNLRVAIYWLTQPFTFNKTKIQQ